jgi:ATP-dependent helicase STH1/SNF2
MRWKPGVRKANEENGPSPLMQLEELPECDQTDEPFDLKEVEDLVTGRGQRHRNIVSYNDGLSDDAWAMVYFLTKKSPFFPNLCLQALEEGEDIQELSERAKDKKDQHIHNKLLKDNGASGRGTPVSEPDGRGRKPKKVV